MTDFERGRLTRYIEDAHQFLTEYRFPLRPDSGLSNMKTPGLLYIATLKQNYTPRGGVYRSKIEYILWCWRYSAVFTLFGILKRHIYLRIPDRTRIDGTEVGRHSIVIGLLIIKIITIVFQNSVISGGCRLCFPFP